MTSPTGLVDFFVLEASDYAERLDGAVATGGLRGPDPETLARYGRALRGTATMSRFPAIAELAGAIERVGRAMHDGRLPWSPALAGAITSGVDEVKLLVRAARQWTPEHEARARARSAELLGYVPPPAAAATTIAGNAAAYLGGEVSAIATGLMAYLTTGGNEGALSLVLRRARAVQGVATTKDAPPVADVVGAVERTAALLEARPAGDRAGTPAAAELFSAAAVVLQRAAADLRAGRAPEVPVGDLERFEAARAAVDGGGAAETVVPIAHFLAGEGPAAIVRAAPNPPMTARARFRTEMVSQAEHLRRLVAEARAAADLVSRTRAGQELERALRVLARTSTSFGEGNAAAYFGRMADRARSLDAQALADIDAAGATLAGSRPSTGAAAAAPAAPSAPAPAVAAPPAAPLPSPPPAPPAAATRPAASAPPPAPTGPPPEPAPPSPRPARSATPIGGRRTPSGRELQSLLQEGLAGLGGLQSAPLGEASPRPRGAVAPMAPATSGAGAAAAYSGRAALDRARAIRDTLRARGTPSDPLLAELFELLDRIGGAP